MKGNPGGKDCSTVCGETGVLVDSAHLLSQLGAQGTRGRRSLRGMLGVPRWVV